jgi:hypothetical protein
VHACQTPSCISRCAPGSRLLPCVYATQDLSIGVAGASPHVMGSHAHAAQQRRCAKVHALRHLQQLACATSVWQPSSPQTTTPVAHNPTQTRAPRNCAQNARSTHTCTPATDKASAQPLPVSASEAKGLEAACRLRDHLLGEEQLLASVGLSRAQHQHERNTALPTVNYYR